MKRALRLPPCTPLLFQVVLLTEHFIPLLEMVKRVQKIRWCSIVLSIGLFSMTSEDLSVEHLSEAVEGNVEMLVVALLDGEVIGYFVSKQLPFFKYAEGVIISLLTSLLCVFQILS